KVLARAAHGVHRRRRAARGDVGHGRVPRVVPRGHRFRRPQGEGHGDHRRAGARPPRALRRCGGLLRVRRAHDGHRHRHPDRGGPRRPGARTGGSRHRRRLAPRRRVRRNAQQGPRPPPRGEDGGRV
ncbi:MAG: Anthranilate synthase, aminase component, partial [uncultured Gemmatimonadetes bacterium]